MSTNYLNSIIETLKQLEAEEAKLKKKIEDLKDELKNELEERETEELNTGLYIIRWTSILSTRFDTKRFKIDLGEEIYNEYTKQVSSRRFTIS